MNTSNNTFSTIANATGFSTPWTQRMLTTGKGKNLTVKQIAERLNLSKVRIYRAIKNGELSVHKTADGIVAATLLNVAKWRLSISK